MIRYALACDSAHAFESWFRSSDDYEAQVARSLVSCPVCGSVQITKQVMAPQVARTDAEMPPAETPALMDQRATAIRRMIGDLHRYLAENSEDVGPRFADEARKIHYGESEERVIHGKTTGKEAEALVEEGISILPLPALPDERS
ncbi:MAG: DUF1178 family protein [Proteobacteria bacterium]|nr:DUF1178 family protein [Pseudomonadota bacterium]